MGDPPSGMSDRAYTHDMTASDVAAAGLQPVSGVHLRARWKRCGGSRAVKHGRSMRKCRPALGTEPVSFRPASSRAGIAAAGSRSVGVVDSPASPGQSRSSDRLCELPAPPPECLLTSDGTTMIITGQRGTDYAQLSRHIRSAALLRRRPVAYATKIALTLAGYAATCALIGVVGDSWWQLALALALGVAYTQVAFLGHDGGHQQIFASRRANDLCGQLTGNLLIGLSYGWWVGKHNRHHANPNKEDHDPDIGEGVLAFTAGQVATRRGPLARMIARRQAWLFFPLLTLEGINLHVASVRSLRLDAVRSSRGGHRRTELALLATHLTAYAGGLLLVMSPLHALAFAAVHQAAFGLYMGCAFAPNHKGMPILPADEQLDYLRRQVLTSRNVRGGWFTDWLLGGLNYQIEHHLFPNMPRPTLRRAQPIVRAYCAGLDLDYTETSLIGSYVAALRHLNQLGRPLRV
jgi:fatty acid desaturase